MGNCWSFCTGNQRKQSTHHERTALLHSEHVSSSCSCHSQGFSVADPSQDQQEALSKIVLRTSERLIDMYTLTSDKSSLPEMLVRQSDDLKRLEQLTAPETHSFNHFVSVGMTRKEWELIESVSMLVKQAVDQEKTIKDVGPIIVKLDKFEETG
ncbi:hypothetical protein PORY_002269 [Pneumocystis oryctolagi]|uniref:Uncharacterized protein n=1 Tax=Pneumocystis oryctolagi TaxID=42067 RepID=A0ACB7CGU3_9ASCO|nr:hypothetical protein PORY_002269 [Pneumocystis oryctolagi]